jgi:lysozyme
MPLPAGVPATAVRVIDLFHSDQPDFHGFVAAGVKAAYLKATQGDSEVDPRFHDFYTRAKSVGLLVGAYHFFKPSSDPTAQMKHFLAVAKPVAGDLIPCIDSETDGTNVGARTWSAAQFLHKALKTWPVIYSGDSFFQDHLVSFFGLGTSPRWIARYGHKPVTQGVDLWQFSESVRVAPDPTPLDADVYLGDGIDAFKAKFLLLRRGGTWAGCDTARGR